MSESLNRFQAWLAAEVMSLPQMAENVSWRCWGDDGGSHFAGIVSAQSDPSLSTVFSLPNQTGHLFLTLSDGDAVSLARVLAHLDECDASGEIHQSHVVRFDYEYLVENGYVGVYLCAPVVSPLFKQLKEPMVFESNTAHPTLVIFITESEYEIWKNRGSDGLLDHFDEAEKDLVTFGGN